MFSRLSLLARHCARAPLSSSTTTAANLATPFARPGASTMVSYNMAALERSTRTIHTAGCLIIGDEVLGGKVADTNSTYFARYCFALGITLKRIEVVADDEEEIMEAARRMSADYDFVVTSGGIGPTHDDITYASIAKAFDLPLVLHESALERMKRLSRHKPGWEDFSWDNDTPALRAKLRMIQLPYDKGVPYDTQMVYTSDDLWVPIAVVNGNVHILPGVPRLFERLLDGLKPIIVPRLEDPEGKGVYRILFSTPLPESEVAHYLTLLSDRVAPKNIKVGSYPRWGRKTNTVTLVGRDREYMESLVSEVVANVQGRRIEVEGEDDDESGSDRDQ